jgi:hypothetical protein
MLSRFLKTTFLSIALCLVLLGCSHPCSICPEKMLDTLPKYREICLQEKIAGYSMEGEPWEYGDVVTTDGRRIALFQKDFREALASPGDMSWISPVSQDGLRLRHDVELSEFVKHVDLHEKLHQFLFPKEAHLPQNGGGQSADVAAQGKEASALDEMRKDFKQREALFINGLADLDSLKSRYDYRSKLERLYRGFLVSFMREHESFFVARFKKKVKDCSGVAWGYGAFDGIDEVCFMLNSSWPGPKEENYWRLQSFRVGRCNDGRTLLVGFQRGCEGGVHVYVWDEKGGDIPLWESIPHWDEVTCDADLKPKDPIRKEVVLNPRVASSGGGCDHMESLAEGSWFDGRYFVFHGWQDGFLHFRYDVEANQWAIARSPLQPEAPVKQ